MEQQARTVTATHLIAASFCYRVLKSSIVQTSALSISQYCVLLELQDAAVNSHPANIGQLASRLSLTPSAISIALRDLEDSRLASCLGSRDDNRKVDISITAKGDSEVKRIEAGISEAIAYMCAGLTFSQRQLILNAVLKTMSEQKRLRIESGRLRNETAFTETVIVCFNAFKEAARLHRISINETIALAWLCDQQKPRPISELSHAILQKLNYVVQVNNKLVSRSLVRRELSSSDRRISMLSITNAGKQRFNHVQKDLDKVMHDFFSKCTQEEWECFKKSADAIVAEDAKRNRYS